MSDDKIILTADEAIALLPMGAFVHNYINPNGMMIGCDYERPKAIEVIKDADLLELGGDNAKMIGLAPRRRRLPIGKGS